MRTQLLQLCTLIDLRTALCSQKWDFSTNLLVAIDRTVRFLYSENRQDSESLKFVHSFLFSNLMLAGLPTCATGHSILPHMKKA